MRNWRSLSNIARKVSKKTGQVNGQDYEGLVRRVLASGDPYQVEILRRQGRYQVRVTVEEVPAPIHTDPRHGWVEVDTNSTFLALCHVLPNGNPHAFATIGDPRLFDVRSTQRDALGEVSRSRPFSGLRLVERDWSWKTCSSCMIGM